MIDKKKIVVKPLLIFKATTKWTKFKWNLKYRKENIGGGGYTQYSVYVKCSFCWNDNCV